MIFNKDLDDTSNDVDDTTNDGPIISKNTVSKNKIYNLHSDYSGINLAEKVIAEGIADSFWRIQRNCSTIKGQSGFTAVGGLVSVQKPSNWSLN